MSMLQDMALDQRTMESCLHALEHSQQHLMTMGERRRTERERKRAIRKLLKADTEPRRIVWYRCLLVHSALLGRRLPALAEFCAQPET